MSQTGGNRRVDRILRPEYVGGLATLSLDDLRSRRDECLAEREYLSLLRRLVQGRAEILKAELERRHEGGEAEPLIDRLAHILAPEAQRGGSRGEALRVGVPEEEMAQARRRLERLVSDAAISDPSALDDEQLAEAVDLLVEEERGVSKTRSEVLAVLDSLQDELKRRYKEDVSQVLS
ncbi:MAG TPA: aerial mycelium formation protein [Actinomycetota bacterium]|nr:aerial mycelium formation protein [Actinomycetota bacterium]